jgi:hypothetical protein
MQDAYIAADALRFLAKLNLFAAGALGGPHSGLTEKDQFLLAHRWRMLRFSQGIEVTVGAGLLDPAGALLRVLIELGYVIAAIADDPNRLIDLFKQGQVESRKALEGLKKELAPNERDDLLTDDFLDAQIASLGAGSGFAAYNWAGLAKSKGSYATIYRLVSRHSHGGTKGTVDYFEGLDTDSPRLRPNIPADLAPEYCLVAASLMFDALTVLPLQTMTDDRTAQLSTMKTTWDALMGRTNKLDASDVH